MKFEDTLPEWFKAWRERRYQKQKLELEKNTAATIAFIASAFDRMDAVAAGISAYSQRMSKPTESK